MFGPNTHIKTKVNINYSHRDKNFIELYKRVQHKFKTIFDLENYEIIFIPGSSTLSMEAIIFSLNGNINVIGNEGTFKRRWKGIVNHYDKTGFDYSLFCQLETSNSKIFEIDKKAKNIIVDCVSSFPYYDIPENADIFVTCTNKQLGSLFGLGIIGIKKDFIEKNLCDENIMSYLNLNRYLYFNKIYQTPTTCPTYVFEHFEKVLNNFNIFKFRKRIEINSKLIYNAIDIKEAFLGELICPVLTIKKTAINLLTAEKYQLYGINKKSQFYQIFTYSCKDKDYYKFYKELKYWPRHYFVM